MGKFDAAIEELMWILDAGGIPSRHRQIKAAIRVLEATSKVDERDLGRVFMGFVSAEMRELLEAIKAAKEDE